MLVLRILVASVMLGVTILLQVRQGAEFSSTPLRLLYLLVGMCYLLSIAYVVAAPRVRDQERFAAFQLALDVAVLGAVVLITGGVASLFLNVYFLVIVGAGILFSRRGSLLAAAASACSYAAASWAPFSARVGAVVDPEGVYRELGRAAVGSRILLAVFAFGLVAFLASHLAESLRRVGEELHVASTSLAALEHRSEHILQSIASGLLTTDLAGRVTYCNRAAARIARLDPARVIGARFQEVFRLLSGEDPFSAAPPAGESPLRAEAVLRDREGEALLGMAFSTLRDERGEVTGLICAFQDLTQVRRMEARIRRSDRLAAVGELAAGMAHEIRNPLASLSGSIQLLREELVLDPTGRELMDIVTREVARLDSLITDFLQFASPRPLRLEPADLGPILRETVTLLQQSVGPGTRVVLEETGPGPVSAEVDASLLRQVFWNLSRNALQAMPQGGTLTVTLSPRGSGEGLEVAFRDTGVGITQEQMAKIFTPFFSTKEGGTGLGLAIVHRIVEAHGGRVEVEGAPGRGCTFRVLLPSRQDAPLEAATSAAVAAP